MTAAVRAESLFACMVGTPLAHERVTADDISRSWMRRIVRKCNYSAAAITRGHYGLATPPSKLRYRLRDRGLGDGGCGKTKAGRLQKLTTFHD
jgi:hypothetical protein